MTDLERELVALGERLDVPGGEDLAARVRHALVARQRRAPWRRVAIVIAALGAAVGAAAAAPVVADWLGVGGVEVRQERTPLRPRLGGPLDLGRPVTLADAKRSAGFELVFPPRLGAPDEVWVDNSSGNEVFSFVYHPRPGLPAAASTGVGALLTQAQVGIADELLASKFAEPGTRIERVELGSGRALWIEGIHYIAFRDAVGFIVSSQLRLADNVLLWERGRVTVRLETGRGRDEALRIAKSVR